MDFGLVLSVDDCSSDFCWGPSAIPGDGASGLDQLKNSAKHHNKSGVVKLPAADSCLRADCSLDHGAVLDAISHSGPYNMKA